MKDQADCIDVIDALRRVIPPETDGDPAGSPTRRPGSDR
jgi:hypothetical protein